MNTIRPGSRALNEICSACRPARFSAFKQQGSRRSYAASRAKVEALNNQQIWRRSLAVLLTIGGAGTVLYNTSMLELRELHAEAPPAPAEMVFEKPKKKKGISKEENRDMISSQHLQVKQSWENPGVYAWGSNSGRVAAPDSDEAFIKTPRRLPFFDGQLLRDIKLDRNFGAAIMENGDLVQWGTAYSAESRQPTPTLKGKNLIQLEVSRDRIIALSSSGKVYSLPVSQEDQLSGPKPVESSWFWSSTTSPISYRVIDVPNSEKIKRISSGLDHVLLLSSTGRLYAATSSSTDFPSKGQLGIPGLTFTSRPPGQYDQAHELTTLRGFNIAKIAAGDYHSLAADTEGRLFAFGDNTLGQLGFDVSSESPYVDAPSLLPLTKIYAGSNQTPRVTDVFAGGVNSFFTVDATQVAPLDPGSKNVSRIPVGRVTADTWAFGQGTFGTLGTGRWTHAQDSPVKLKSLSGLFEWDETTNSAVPIRLARLSVGSTHAAATMANVTHVGAHAGSSENDTNWGADVVWWGGNEYWQLGTGKRNNVATPMYIRPLDSGKEKEKGEEHRFQCTPRGRVKVEGRWVDMEQRVECGRMVSAVYSGVCK
jgi:alpha-tubulin suppressor-like RCC1 family protein